MDSRDERLLENQTTFRSANERLSEMAQVDDGKFVPFLCECADIECLGRLEATLSEFELIHEDRHRFFILPGHALMDGEEILVENRRYGVVSKAAA